MARASDPRAIERTALALYVRLEGARHFLSRYAGCDEGDLSKWDLGMIRHYQAVEREALDGLEEIENGSPRAG